MLSIEYRESDRRALIEWAPEDANAQWLAVLRRLLFDHTDDAAQEHGYCVSLPWWSFVALRNPLLEIFKGYGLNLGQGLAVGTVAANLLRQSKRSADGYMLATTAQSIPEVDLRARLKELGFARDLSPEQARNVSKIAALPAAATFSVPGAGKTTEALATFFFRAQDDERLLVVAPKNAFAAWDEQIKDCMPHLNAAFARLRSGKDKIAKQLDDDPRFMLITYQQLARVPDLIAAHCARYKVHVYLDESHRIKSGIAKQTARAALALSCLPVGKLIMSGTPMPQSTDDLIPIRVSLSRDSRRCGHRGRVNPSGICPHQQKGAWASPSYACHGAASHGSDAKRALQAYEIRSGPRSGQRAEHSQQAGVPSTRTLGCAAAAICIKSCAAIR